jgi:hypothetical protein
MVKGASRHYRMHNMLGPPQPEAHPKTSQISMRGTAAAPAGRLWATVRKHVERVCRDRVRCCHAVGALSRAIERRFRRPAGARGIEECIRIRRPWALPKANTSQPFGLQGFPRSSPRAAPAGARHPVKVIFIRSSPRTARRGLRLVGATLPTKTLPPPKRRSPPRRHPQTAAREASLNGKP